METSTLGRATHRCLVEAHALARIPIYQATEDVNLFLVQLGDCVGRVGG